MEDFCGCDRQSPCDEGEDEVLQVAGPLGRLVPKGHRLAVPFHIYLPSMLRYVPLEKPTSPCRLNAILALPFPRLLPLVHRHRHGTHPPPKLQVCLDNHADVRRLAALARSDPPRGPLLRLWRSTMARRHGPRKTHAEVSPR